MGAVRLRPSRVAGVLLALLLLWLGVGAWQVWSGVRSALSARDVIESVTARYSTEQVARGEADDLLIEARDQLRSAAAALGSTRSVLVRNLPIVGRHVQVGSTLSSGGAELIDVGLELSSELRLLETQLENGDVEFVAGLNSLVAPLEQLAERTRRVDFGAGGSLVAPLAAAHREAVSRQRDLLEALDRGADGAAGLAAFLEGPSRYLLFAANTSQMQSGMGSLLSVAQVEVVEGDLSVTDVTTVSDLALPAEPVELDADYAARWGWMDPNDAWSSLGGTPRFDVTAETAARMWEASGHEPVDGVMVVDAVAVGHLAGVLGPVRVDGRLYDEAELLRYLAHDQYLELSDDIYGDWRSYADAQVERRDRLAAIAAQLVARLGADGVDKLDVALALADAARGRHVMFWSATETQQAGWRAAGFSGELSQSSMLLSLVNRSATKADFFLQLSANVSIQRFETHSEVVVEVEGDNGLPFGEPRYVGGPHPELDLRYGEHLGVLALNIPAWARNGRVDGDTQLAVAGADGPTRVVGSWITVPRNESGTRVFRFDLPPEVTEINIEPGARFPVTRWQFQGRHFDDGRPTVIEF